MRPRRITVPRTPQDLKRSWLLAGYARPRARAVVATPLALPLRPNSKLLLAGTTHVRGLVPPLRALCSERGVVLAVLELPPGGSEVTHAGVLAARVVASRPDVVLVAAPCSSVVAAAVKEACERIRARALWLVPPEGCGSRLVEVARLGLPIVRADVLNLPRGPDGRKPTVSGYAGWTGVLWQRMQPWKT